MYTCPNFNNNFLYDLFGPMLNWASSSIFGVFIPLGMLVAALITVTALLFALTDKGPTWLRKLPMPVLAIALGFAAVIFVILVAYLGQAVCEAIVLPESFTFDPNPTPTPGA